MNHKLYPAGPIPFTPTADMLAGEWVEGSDWALPVVADVKTGDQGWLHAPGTIYVADAPAGSVNVDAGALAYRKTSDGALTSVATGAKRIGHVVPSHTVGVADGQLVLILIAP